MKPTCIPAFHSFFSLQAFRLSAFSTALLLLTPGVAFAWGQGGHNAVASIAEANLAPKTKAAIERLLGNRSIVYYAMWLDDYRHTPEYKHTETWHTAAAGADFKYAAKPDGKGDVVSAIEQSMAALANRQSLPAETLALHIRILVHALGDLHCPGNVEYQSIKTGFSVSINGRSFNYSSVWNNQVVDAHRWGYIEWNHQTSKLLSKEKITALTAGTPRDWFHETALDSRDIYKWAKSGQKLESDDNTWTDFLNKAKPFAETQIMKAGHRLAGILNDLFGQ